MIALAIRYWRVIAIVAALILSWRIYEAIKDRGRQAAVSEIEKTNQEATDAARRAREAHDLACARNEPGCLSDAWTRDGRR